jgi:2-hydroxychromene-2-carboxylate isomerase
MARQTAGNAGLDNLYLALGDLRYEQGRELDDETVLSDALVRADLPASLLEEARSNQALDEALQRQYEHAWLSGAFGVPTIYIDHSEVPYFGPVIAGIPPEEEAGELWDLILGISRYSYFYELKRERR